MGLFGSNGKDKKQNKSKYSGSSHNTQEENSLLQEIENSQEYAEGGKRPDVETDWDDEYKIYIGKQWDTSKGFRTSRGKKRNFNSQDNFILPMIQNMLSSFSTTPEPELTGEESDDDNIAEDLGDLVAFILDRNDFAEQWEKIVLQMIQYGPVIGYVPWDQHWIGGSGPNRWVGEVRTLFLKKKEFFPDPAILDLEERMQECSYINLKKRKKLQWFADTWEKGEYVREDTEDIPKGQEDEGENPQQATLIIHFHKGVPKYVPEEWKKDFLQKAEEAEADGLPYKAQDYRDMANGTLKGVHCAYKAGTILLDYVPYIYDDGLYPFAYKVLYVDEEQPFGMGEERNTIIPQILHNKSDEIELGAMLGQGLGGGVFNKGALSEGQKQEFIDNRAKGNAWNEVNDINGIKPNQPVQVPSTISKYKEDKKNIIDTVSGNTAILQGISPGANVPYSTVAELGARGDARTRYKAKILARFMKQFIRLIVNRVVQFYTVDRKYRILGERQNSKIEKESYKMLTQIAGMPQGTPPQQQLQAMINLLMYIKTQQQKPRTAKFNRSMLVRTWDREVITEVDEYGNKVEKPLKEEFVPEFDINVKVLDERPTDRNYWTNLAMEVLGKALGPKCFWKIIDEGKLPPIDEILEELQEMQKAQAQTLTQQAQMAMTQEAQEAQADREASYKKINMQGQEIKQQIALQAMIDMATGRGEKNNERQSKQAGK